ncbi:glycosyltransferase family 9 protein, partial [Burkholderia pseudomallei]
PLGIVPPALHPHSRSSQDPTIGVDKELPCLPCLKNYLGTVPSACCLGTTACLSASSTDDVAQAMNRAVHRSHVVPIA